MKLINKILILFFFTTCHVRAQVYFNKRIDFDNRSEIAVSILVETEGYIITGSGRYLTDFSRRMMFVKTDLNGDTVIKKHYGKQGFSYSEGWSNSLIKTNDAGYALGGGVIDSAANRSKALLVKYNEFGDTLWTKTYTLGDYDYAMKCRQTNDNGFILAGFTQVYNGSFFEPPDFYLIKTDSLGNLEWKKKYGGIYDDVAMSIEITKDNGFLMSGYSYNSSNESDIMILKTNSLGNQLWQKKLSTNFIEGALGAFEQSDGNYIVYGYRYITSTDRQSYIAKLDSNRDIVWEKKYGTPYLESIISLKELDDGNFIASAVGRKISNPNVVYGQLIKFSSNGDTLWSRLYGGDSGAHYAYAVSLAADGGFIFVGSTLDSGIDQDMWIVKTDSLGITCDTIDCCYPDSLCNEYIDTTVGLINVPIIENKSQINAYPNPFTNETTLILPCSNKNGLGLIFTLYNILGGKQDISYTFYFTKDRSEIKLNRGDLQPGLYFYKVRNKNRTIGTGKLFIN